MLGICHAVLNTLASLERGRATSLVSFRVLATRVHPLSEATPSPQRFARRKPTDCSQTDLQNDRNGKFKRSRVDSIAAKQTSLAPQPQCNFEWLGGQFPWCGWCLNVRVTGKPVEAGYSQSAVVVLGSIGEHCASCTNG
eukprot:5341147-Amphidinium_carterae.1